MKEFEQYDTNARSYINLTSLRFHFTNKTDVDC